ncbi:MAG: PaaX family transcriptional regulator [Actinomycetota bacterium]|nr:PaaX family transcriptional regulator [Actinomycetota bacterium]
MKPTGSSSHVVTRRHQAGGSSARSLLMTVLGEFVLPTGAPVWTQTLVEVLGLLGVEEKSARQSLARTAADGWLASDRDGRRVRWSLTDSGQRLLTEGAQRIYGFGTHRNGWDGRWLVLAVTVPELQRRLRHRLRTRLAWAGLGSPAAGLWVTPDASKEPEVAQVVAEQGLTGSAFCYVGRFGSIGEPQTVVAQAWDLARVEKGYEQFVADVEAAAPTTPAEVFVTQLRLVHAWRRFPFVDPQLPTELLPAQWAGVRAADVFRRRHAEWEPAARRQWASLAGLDTGNSRGPVAY